MFSKFLTSLFATKVLAYTPVSNPTKDGQTPTWACNQCIQGGYTFCQNQNWYMDLKATDGIPTTICCDLSNGGTCTGNEDTDPTFSCSDVFASPQQAIAACPTKQSICGKEKTIELAIGETRELTNVNYDLLANTPCTWIIKSNCGAPGFTFAKTNSMTSTQALLQVNEWDSQQVVADQVYGPWPDHKFNEAATGVDVKPPMNAWNDGYQDQSSYPTTFGQLGNIRYHPPFDSTTMSDYNMTIPGDLITDWIYTKVTEFTAYEADLKIYDYKRKEYNGALRFAGKQTQMKFNIIDKILPEATTAQTAYTAPQLTSIPWHPSQYGGPEIKSGVSNVEIDVGFGSPTTYMYALKFGNAIDPEWRMFGSMGVTSKPGPYAIRLDSTSGARYATCEPGRYSYMALTLLPVAGYVQSTNSEKLNITIGAFDWRSDTYLTKTTQPPAPLQPDETYMLGAHSLQTAVFSTLVAITAAQFV